ncbi:MAG: CRISPR-associated endonuclease Cas1 [Verrucomicrobiales bacterium]|nr:CRISPR-associated endonuclease Cas1 [Verrucomicrobiales bacterium]
MKTETQPIMPVRRLHNYIYCERLFYLQWVEDLWVENADTTAGSHTHRSTDKPSHWKDEVDLSDRARVRSISIESEKLGLRGVIDLVESEDDGMEVIDYKKGAARKDLDGQRIPKENDAIQVAAYCLLLREKGHRVEKASIYYAEEKTRVPVDLTDDLFQIVEAKTIEARKTALREKCPPPLKNDPRCLHCSAYSICLPNESTFWMEKKAASAPPPKPKLPPRPPKDDGEIVIVQDPKGYVGIRGGEIQVRINKEIVSKHPIEQVNGVYLYGAVQISTQATQLLLQHTIPISYFSPAGRFLGMTQGLPASGIDARVGQVKFYEDCSLSLPVIREMIRSKIHNQRVQLMRNGKAAQTALQQLAVLRDRCPECSSAESLRGLEGRAAAIYFENFSTMIKGYGADQFDFDGRNRRPATDPVNALLSLGYSILAKELTGLCHSVGLDPFIGILHEPRYGRPALALDLMEEFRPLIADSVAMALINRGEIGKSDFRYTSKGVVLSDSGRKQFWRAWFRRLDTEVKHPQFEYRMSYRRMMDVQARQLWRIMRGDTDSYYGFTTR